MRRLPWIGLALVTAVALVWRMVAAASIEYPSVDGVNYMTVARALVRDGALQFSTFPPGWPLLIAIVLSFIGTVDAADVLRAAQIANVTLGTLAVPLVFLFLRHGFGPWVALLGATVVGLLPDNVILSSVDLSEMSYLAVFVGGWVLWHRRHAWAAGAAFGFAYLVRPEALIVLVAMVAVRSLATREITWKPMATALPFVIAYVLFVHDATGAWSLSGKTAFLDRAAAAGGSPVSRWFTNAGTLFGALPGVIGLPVVLLAAWGAVRRRGIELVALGPVLLLPVFDFRMEARYWIPLVPFVLWFAAAGARDVVERAPEHRRRLAAVGLAVLVAVGTTVAARPDVAEVGRNHEAFEGLRAAGRWIGENSTPDETVVGYKPYAAFWAGRPAGRLPQRDGALATIDRLRDQGHDFLVVNALVANTVARVLHPLLTPLDLDVRYARRLELVHVVDRPDDPRQTTLVYRIVPYGR